MPNWNPIQYEKFLKDRTQPAIDLSNRLEEFAPNRILDLGCGPGNSTKLRPYLEQLTESDKEDLVNDVFIKLKQLYKRQKNYLAAKSAK